MRKSPVLVVAAWTLVGAAGCQDTWAGFGREERNLKNELADYMIRIVDEETAQYVVEGPAKKLKEKWEDHKERLTKYIAAQDLGQIQMIFRKLEKEDKATMGAGQRVRTFTKAADGQVTIEGPAFEGSDKETIDTLTDPAFLKAKEAANIRLREQAERIGRIQPSGPFLQKAQGLPKGTFGL